MLNALLTATLMSFVVLQPTTALGIVFSLTNSFTHTQQHSAGKSPSFRLKYQMLKDWKEKHGWATPVLTVHTSNDKDMMTGFTDVLRTHVALFIKYFSQFRQDTWTDKLYQVIPCYDYN